jgi:hypothetical protein
MVCGWSVFLHLNQCKFKGTGLRAQGTGSWNERLLGVNSKLKILKVVRKKSKKKKKIKFELTLGGLFGIGAVLFCILLWMFLLGIWAGQEVLLPPG